MGKVIIMIGVQFKRFSGEYMVDCESCSDKIRKEQPFFELYLSEINQTIHICEDCGNALQNSMADEYCRFVDLGC